MNNHLHAGLADRWRAYSIYFQMANIGAEVGRCLAWKYSNPQRSRAAFHRALELTDFTIGDPKNRNCLRELCVMREVFCDHVVGDNQYHSSAEGWDRYFYHFTVAARKK